MNRPAKNYPLLFGSLFLASQAWAEVKLPAIFSTHMVLQREVSIPVWGWAEPGEKVTVSIAGQTKTTAANSEGKWTLKLDALSSRDPLTLTAKGKNTLTVEDVLVGEVWLASGQSNMQLQLNAVNNAPAEKAGATFPKIRVFTVERRAAITPESDCGGKWVVCDPATAGNFSAVAYFFGRDLHQTLAMPVGMIDASWGGTPIEAWTSLSAQEKKAKELAPVFKIWSAKTSVPFDEAKAKENYERQRAAWEVNSEKAEASGKKPAAAPKLAVEPRWDKNHPANLFNGLIAPIIPYAIRGAIWYQGENNSHGEFAKLYETQLPLMIQDWRQRWQEGDFPFAWVQLPNFKKRSEDPNAPSDWAVTREAMLHSLAIPNTGMAVTIDVGEAANIHPKDKQTVGKRLALWARAQVYGEKIPFFGPQVSGHKIDHGEVTISFTHLDGGLVAKEGELVGFSIAGADHKWVWAKARIAGDHVVVSSPEVPVPAAVRYAWADNPACNLYNGAGLPASPFRTDDWP